MAAFKKIGIIGRVKTPGVKETVLALVNYLQGLKQSLMIERETAELLPSPSLPIITREELGKNCDLVIVVGGDGSLINAAHAVVDYETPVLGINRGSLGFLTDILPKHLEKIKDILEGKYTIEKRFLLTSRIELHDKKIGEDDALNEVAMIPDAVPHMVEFEIYIDDKFVCSQDSDSLNNRPIVIEGDREIRIIISPHNQTSPRLSSDGRDYITTPPGSHIIIRKKAKKLHLIHPLDYNYYEALRSKLHWGKKLNYTE